MIISQLGVLMCYQVLHSKNSFFIIVNLDIALFAAKQKENSSIYLLLVVFILLILTLTLIIYCFLLLKCCLLANMQGIGMFATTIF